MTESSGSDSSLVERRHMTVLVCDLVDSTKLSDKLDPEDLKDLLNNYRKSVVQLIEKMGGCFGQFAGDAIWAYFGYPKAHEDDVYRAICAALEITNAIESLLSHGENLQARVGIATGLCVVGDMNSTENETNEKSVINNKKSEITALGYPPNLAARLQTLAEPACVVIADETRSLAGKLFDFKDLGLHELKGFEQPVKAWKVLNLSNDPSLFKALRNAQLLEIIGRDTELELLQNAWNQTCNGKGQVIHVFGEAGIGKSKLVTTFADHIFPQKDDYWQFHCLPHLQGSAFAPISTCLQRLANFHQSDSVETKRNKLTNRYLIGHGVSLALLSSILSIDYETEQYLQMSPPRRRERLFEVLIKLVEQACSTAPQFLITEDIHWIDPSTAEFLKRLISRTRDMRLLLIITSRNESGETPFNTDPSLVNSLKIGPLKKAECFSMLEALWREDTLLKKVAQIIFERTDGVPLFIEEVMLSLLHSMKSIPTSVFEQYLDKNISIPSKLQDQLMSRIDQLGNARFIAQVGSVVSREFTYSMLEELTDLTSIELDQGVNKLISSGLVAITNEGSDPSFKFKHSMVRDAAYQSLLKKDRAKLHGRIAEWIETAQTDFGMSRPEIIAYHYELAGNLDIATKYWLDAGRLSTSRAGYTEATGHLNKAYKLLLTQPESLGRDKMELDIIIALGAAHAGSGGYSGEDTGKVYERARELCRKIGNPPETLPVMSGAGSYQFMRANYSTAIEIADQCLQLSDSESSSTGKLIGHRIHGAVDLMNGNFDAAITHAQTAIELYDENPELHRRFAVAYALDHKTTAMCYLSLGLLAIGKMDKALDAANQSLAHSELVDKHSVNYALCFKAAVHHLSEDDPEITFEVATRSRDLAKEETYLNWLWISRLFRGDAMIRSGQKDEGLKEIQQGMSEHADIQATTYLPIAQSILAKGYLANHRTDDALSILEKAELLSKETRQDWYTPELQRLHAEALVQMKKYDEAYDWYQTALDSAERIKARFWTLKIALSIARNMTAPERQQEAYKLLREATKMIDYREGLNNPIMVEVMEIL